VTCPTVRIHPAVIAHAAATASVQCEGRFVLGVGSGEALNEHILGDRWPPTPIRQDMLEEAIEVIRLLHTGRELSHHGRYYTVEDARIYTVAPEPVPIYISGFGPRATKLAGRVADGFCTTMPDRDMVDLFRESGGGDKPVQGGMKVCWADSQDAGIDTAHRLWANEALPGKLAQILPRPRDFEQASTLVTRDMIGEAVACGPDPDDHIKAIEAYLIAGFDEIYVSQIGPDQEQFFDAWSSKVLPALS